MVRGLIFFHNTHCSNRRLPVVVRALLCAVAAFGPGFLSNAAASQAETTESSDAEPRWEQLHWELHRQPGTTRVSAESVTERGETLQRFKVTWGATPEPIEIRAAITPSLLHEDFEAALRLHSSVRGIRFGLVVVLPHHVDPRTRKPLEMILRGQMIEETESWQVLRAAATRKAIEAQMRLVRAELHQPQIRSQDAMIVGLALMMESSPGEAFFDVGRSAFGPVVAPPDRLREMIPVVSTEEAQQAPTRQFIPLDIELNAMLLDGHPVILRMAPDHDEAAGAMRQSGLNAVWVPDYRATERARDLYNAGLAVLATPPHPQFEPGDFSRLLQALPPLDQQCPHVSAWYEGTRISPEELPHLLAWSREVRSADRTFQRLQMADVISAEGAVAREIDLVGIGRHIIGRDESFGALRNLLMRRQKNAGQLSFPWMWIQTAPSATQQQWRTQIGSQMPVVEPEQIQHQIYSALSAGYKGIGFWKTEALEVENAVSRETALAIELACLEIELLEPVLARGRLEGHLALQTNSEKEKPQATPFLKSAFGGSRMGVSVISSEAPAGHDAAVISTDGTTLILATLWDNVSQFVPGPMFEREVSLTVAASETASAWQISACDLQRFPRNITAGGLALKLTDLDRCAAVLVTSDLKLIQTLEQKMHSMSERFASKQSELASLKYVRTMSTIETLREVHSVPAGIELLMSAAKQNLDRAQYEQSTRDFRQAALYAGDALRNLRQAQQACWKDAVAELTSPTASPHTIAFTTLPDHWRLMHYLDQQSSRLSDNLLSAGDFESTRPLAQEGWVRHVPEKSIYSAAADKVQDSRSGRFLRLVTWQTDPTVQVVQRDDSLPLLLATQPMKVQSGDVVIVTGRIRKGRTSTANINAVNPPRRPLLIFDSELGPECGLRPELDSEWTDFEMYRPIGNSQEFSLMLGLPGQAEVHVDQLQIRRLPAVRTGPFQMTGREEPAP